MDRDRKLPSYGFTVEDNPPPPYSPQPPTTGSSCPPVGYSQHPNPTIPPPGAYGPGVPWPMPATRTSRPSAYGLLPSLHYLTQVDQLFVKKEREMFEWKLKFDVLNALGQLVYRCTEELPHSILTPRADIRDFIVHVYDNHGVEVIRAIRRCEFMSDELEVQCPVGTVAGYVKQIPHFYKLRYDIMDASRTVVLQMKGPSHLAWKDVDFQVLSKDGTIPVGKITKEWPKKFKELFTATDKYGISFPMDLDVKIKAVLLGAVFLIHFRCFEDNESQQRSRTATHFHRF